jgi:translation elongation factor EF-Tu-like GTPase
MSQIPVGAFIEADVQLLSRDLGGRRFPIASGYRCNCWIGNVEDGRSTDNDATFWLIGVERLRPGSRARVRVQPHFPQAWTHLAIGSTFELREGRRTVGIATVVSILPSL